MRDKKLIQMYVTNICNSRCKTCSIWKNKTRQELSLEQIKKIVEPFKDADFVIGGGEAILHSDIENILEYLRAAKVNYTLLSNCILDERLKELITKYDVPNVTVSCDGCKHDEVRGVKGNFEKIVNFVKWCKENDVSFKISYTYSSYNEDWFLHDMDVFKHGIGVDKIYFCLAQNMELLNSSDDVVAKSINQILLRKDMLFDKDLNYILSVIGKRKKKCDSQGSVFTIYSNGNIVRCQSYMSKDVLGNVDDEDVIDILRNKKKHIKCPYDKECNLLCQRRYD